MRETQLRKLLPSKDGGVAVKNLDDFDRLMDVWFNILMAKMSNDKEFSNELSSNLENGDYAGGSAGLS